MFVLRSDLKFATSNLPQNCARVRRFAGIIVPAEETPPSDPYSFSRKAVDHPNYVHATPNDFDKQKQFLVLDRKVLRFFCQWDDPSSSGTKLNAVRTGR